MATTYTISAGDTVRPWRHCEIKHFREGASQSFVAGEPVIQGGAGVEDEIKVAADNPTAAIIGIAAEDASGTQGTKIAVYLARGAAEFLIRTLASDAVDFSDIGAARAIQKHASLALWVVDTTDAGNDAVVILEYRNPTTKEVQNVEADFAVWAVVRFQPGATVYGPGAGV